MGKARSPASSREEDWGARKGREEEGELKGEAIVYLAVVISIIVHVFFPFDMLFFIGSHNFALDIVTSSTFDPPARGAFVALSARADRAGWCHYF